MGRLGALVGFITLAPYPPNPLGGYPGNDDDGRTLEKEQNKDEKLEDFIAAFEYLKEHENWNGNIGVVGFCFGGWVLNMMAVRLQHLKASVPFYGGHRKAEWAKRV